MNTLYERVYARARAAHALTRAGGQTESFLAESAAPIMQNARLRARCVKSSRAFARARVHNKSRKGRERMELLAHMLLQRVTGARTHFFHCFTLSIIVYYSQIVVAYV